MWQCNSPHPDTLRWPNGDYGLLTSAFGCPRIPETTWFKETLTIYSANPMESAAAQRSYLLGSFSDNLVTLNVCNMRRGFNLPSVTQWGTGDYCLLKVNRDSKCDNGKNVPWTSIHVRIILRNSGQRHKLGCFISLLKFFPVCICQRRYPYAFLALLCATAQQSYCRQAGVCRPSVRPSVVRPSVVRRPSVCKTRFHRTWQAY